MRVIARKNIQLSMKTKTEVSVAVEKYKVAMKKKKARFVTVVRPLFDPIEGGGGWGVVNVRCLKSAVVWLYRRAGDLC